MRQRPSPGPAPSSRCPCSRSARPLHGNTKRSHCCIPGTMLRWYGLGPCGDPRACKLRLWKVSLPWVRLDLGSLDVSGGPALRSQTLATAQPSCRVKSMPRIKLQVSIPSSEQIALIALQTKMGCVKSSATVLLQGIHQLILVESL